MCYCLNPIEPEKIPTESKLRVCAEQYKAVMQYCTKLKYILRRYPIAQYYTMKLLEIKITKQQ